MLRPSEIGSSFKCPFCDSEVPVIVNHTVKQRRLSFEEVLSFPISPISGQVYGAAHPFSEYAVMVTYYKCSKCQKQSIFISGLTPPINGIDTLYYPRSPAKQFPPYVPRAIREDYEEACAIASLSPKAAATLCRRALQGMVRDFWEVSGSNLAQEINSIKDKVNADQWRVIDAVRRLGNIGAHMEKDVNLIIDIDEQEVAKLIMLIEHLIKAWYIERENMNQLFDDITSIDEEKQKARSATSETTCPS